MLLLILCLSTGCPTDDPEITVDVHSATELAVDTIELEDVEPAPDSAMDTVSMETMSDASRVDSEPLDVEEPDVFVGCLTNEDCLEELDGQLICSTPLCEDGECIADPNVSLNGTPCSEATPCADAGVCEDGECISFSGKCDDGNPCTEDQCDEETGVCTNNNTGCPSCLVDADCVPYQSSNVCFGTLHCVAGNCLKDASTIIDCWSVQAAAGPCEQAVCNPNNGDCDVIPRPDGASCTPESLCEDTGVCTAGQCSGPPLDCDDNDPCTVDSCEEGCTYAIAAGPACDDGDACTTDDVCTNAGCDGTPLIDCDDNNPCTDDTCDVATALCINTPNDALCDDGTACTVSDHCENGVCVANAVLCDDQSVCTVDSCDPVLGCSYIPIDCDDNDPCTDDSCDPSIGCVNQLPGTSCLQDSDCDDGLGCTQDFCSMGCGVCKQNPKICDDNNPCTDESCSEPTGQCQAVPKEGVCSDNDPCTLSDSCVNGTCVGQASAACSCQGKADGDTCDDGNVDTTGDFCLNQVCAGYAVYSFQPAANSTQTRFVAVDSIAGTPIAIGQDVRAGQATTWAVRIESETLFLEPSSERSDTRYQSLSGAIAAGTDGKISVRSASGTWAQTGALQTALSNTPSSLGAFSSVDAVWTNGSRALFFGRNAANTCMKSAVCTLGSTPSCKSLGIDAADSCGGVGGGYWPRAVASNVSLPEDEQPYLLLNTGQSPWRNKIARFPGGPAYKLTTVADFSGYPDQEWNDVSIGANGQLWGVGLYGLVARGQDTLFAAMTPLPGVKNQAVVVSPAYVMTLGATSSTPSALRIHDRTLSPYNASSWVTVPLPSIANGDVADAVLANGYLIVVLAPESATTAQVLFRAL